MGIKVYRSCFQRVAGWCEAIEVVRWHSPVSFGGECSSSHRRWFRYTRNESQLGWYRVMNITPLWATTVVLRGFFYCKSLVKLLIWCIYAGISRNSVEIGGFTKLSQWIDIIFLRYNPSWWGTNTRCIFTNSWKNWNCERPSTSRYRRNRGWLPSGIPWRFWSGTNDCTRSQRCNNLCVGSCQWKGRTKSDWCVERCGT